MQYAWIDWGTRRRAHRPLGRWLSSRVVGASSDLHRHKLVASDFGAVWLAHPLWEAAAC